MSLPLYNTPQESERVSILVRFSNNLYSDLQLPVIRLIDLNISWLRQSVRESNHDLSQRRIRFIHSGRVLNEQTNFITEYHNFLKFNLSSQAQAQASAAAEGNGRGAGEQRFVIHCLIGDFITEEELQRENELDNKTITKSTNEAPVGFDRLTSAGFSAEDIANLRGQFRQIYGDLPSNSNNRNADDDDDEEEEEGEGSQRSRDIRQLEDNWIDSTVNEMDEFNQMTTTTTSSFAHHGNEELLVGILIGCLFGVLSLLLLREDGLIGKRMKMAVVAGIIVNLSFGLVRQWS